LHFPDSRHTAEALAASHRFLEIANLHSRMTPLLEAFVAEVKSLTGCEAVGIRVLQENGYIPYVFYDGFKQEFYDLENHISIWLDRCACINIVKGEVDPNLPFYTPGGSFYINRLDEFFCKLSPEERGMFRGNCHKFGYESMALVPIRLGRQILGMIHAADPHKDIIPLAMVELLEKVGLQLGPAFQRIKLEEECRRAEKALREREAKFRAAIETSADGFCISDMAGRFLEFNDAYVNLLGYSREELLKMSVSDIEAQFTAAEIAAIIERVKSEGHVIFETKHRSKDGRVWPAEVNLSYWPIADGRMFVFLRDISERKRTEEALRKSEGRYRSMFQNIHSVMLLIDSETGTIVDANPAACSYYGYSKEELLSKNIAEINTLSPAVTFQRMQQAKMKKRRHFEFRHRLASGEVRDVEVFSGPILFSDRTQLFSIIHDITARKQAEESLRRARDELEQQVAERTTDLR
jgi:PAS domain S-box-containing protein